MLAAVMVLWRPGLLIQHSGGIPSCLARLACGDKGKNGEERTKKKERMKGGKAEQVHIISNKLACQCNGEASGKGCPIGSVYN